MFSNFFETWILAGIWIYPERYGPLVTSDSDYVDEFEFCLQNFPDESHWTYAPLCKK